LCKTWKPPILQSQAAQARDEFGDGDTRVIRRTTTQPVRSIKGQRPRLGSNWCAREANGQEGGDARFSGR
jgi:hypothetical protein